MNRLLFATASAFILSGMVAAHAAGQGSMSSQSSTQPPSGVSGSSRSGAAMGVSQSEIKQAQQQLKQDGYYQGAVDGIVGPETKQAISKYQRAQGLQETARLDQQTLNKLAGSRTTGAGSSASPSGSSGMSGSSSSGSSTMQRDHSSGSYGSSGAGTGTSSKQ